jgi:hypothetical protein
MLGNSDFNKNIVRADELSKVSLYQSASVSIANEFELVINQILDSKIPVRDTSI